MPTGNTQQQINYGSSANDGQGDPLRTAFIKTDDNFDNIWLAGPAGSNVRITNNTIGVLDTNGNLILSPNGIGVIQTNNNLVPRLNKTYDLGSANLQYRTVYANAAVFQALVINSDLSANTVTTPELTVNTIKSDDSTIVMIQDGLEVDGDILVNGSITLTGGNILGAVRVVTTPTALANLTAVAGGRAFVNNANLVAGGNFGNQVGSGGSNTVPVWSDGSNWYIG